LPYTLPIPFDVQPLIARFFRQLRPAMIILLGEILEPALLCWRARSAKGFQ